MEPAVWASDERVVPVRAADCALLVGVPVTEHAFGQTLADPGRWDLAACQRVQLPGYSPDRVWEKFNAVAARAVRSACRTAEDAKVRVVHWAALDDLATVLNAPRADRPKVVTLVSHWRNVSLAHNDVTNLTALRTAIRSSSHPIADALRRELVARLGREGRVDELPATELIDQLAAVVADAHRVIGSAVPTRGTRRSWLDRLGEWFWIRPLRVAIPAPFDPKPVTRAALERAFPDTIRPAPAIEFRDGMRSVEDFLAVIPADFEGVFDLGYCNTTLVGQAVKDHAPGCTVMMSRYPIGYAAWSLMYSVVLAALEFDRQNRGALSYVQVVREARKTATRSRW